VRSAALLPLLLLSAGCLHEPDADLDDGFLATYQPSAEPVTRREVSVAWEGPGQQQAPAPVLAASPKDRPPPDPVPFRIGAGHGALGQVDLSPCREVGLEPGYLRLRVTFQGSGRVVHAAVESPTPPPQDALDCIAEQLEVAMVPRFDGRDATLSKSLFVEPGPEAVDTVVRKGGAPSHRLMTRTTPPTAMAKP
jgi:hypothetical protein